MTKLSANFSLEEMIRSSTATHLGLNNAPDARTIENLRQLCVRILEPLREKLGHPIYITSGYRCVELNKLIGGAEKSQHVEGKAADIEVEGLTVSEVVEIARTLPLFDQLIHEFDEWTHISYQPNFANRREILKATKENGKTIYSQA